MSSKLIFEPVDRYLRICDFKELFGGKILVLAGDFRQILPIVQGGKLEILDKCITNSYFWKNVEILNLTKNLIIEKDQENDNFADYLLAIGDDVITDKGQEIKLLIKGKFFSIRLDSIKIIGGKNNNFQRINIQTFTKIIMSNKKKEKLDLSDSSDADNDSDDSESSNSSKNSQSLDSSETSDNS